MPEQLKSAKLWTFIVTQVVAIINAVVIATAQDQQTIQLVAACLGSVSQIAAVLFAALWGSETGEAKAIARFLR
jgi:hypothetical protein